MFKLEAVIQQNKSGQQNQPHNASTHRRLCAYEGKQEQSNNHTSFPWT